MSDGSYFELLPAGADLTQWHRRFSFGLTDMSDEARFVFSGSVDINESVTVKRERAKVNSGKL